MELPRTSSLPANVRVADDTPGRRFEVRADLLQTINGAACARDLESAQRALRRHRRPVPAANDSSSSEQRIIWPPKKDTGHARVVINLVARFVHYTLSRIAV